MLTLPLMVLFIVGTAVLSSIITTALPYMPKYWNAFKTRIKRRKNTLDNHNLEVLVERMNELEEQMNNVSQNHFRREQNRKGNIRRAVREYLEELKND